MFNFENFFNAHGIEYRTSGSGVKKGNVYCNCPFCANDTKQFMGCDLRTNFWACWWSPEHRGRNPAKLIKALLQCTWAEALEITGGVDDLIPQPGTLADLERRVSALGREVSVDGFAVQQFAPEFVEIRRNGVTAVCWEHLRNERKFREDDVRVMCEYYRLRYAPTGNFKLRMILPILHAGNAMVGFQARALGMARLRYITHPPEIANKRVLFNYGNALKGGKTLVIVEGPFGALKVDFYGKPQGIRCVATLGVSYTEAQVGLVYKLAPRYENVVVLLDPGTEITAMRLAAQLGVFGAVVGILPPGLSGPDELEPSQVAPLILDCVRK
jgi:hypothetical protein